MTGAGGIWLGLETIAGVWSLALGVPFWLIEKHGTRRRRSWRKLHIGVDADTGQILASELTASEVDDGSQVDS